jgi:hypothetical protein
MNLTADQQHLLREQIDQIPKAVRIAFEEGFRAWRGSWSRGSMALSSNPNTRASGPEFEKLWAMGPQVLPLVVEKLADPENFFALQLYDRLQRNDQLRIELAPTDPRIAEGEQGRAKRTVETWFLRSPKR